MTDFSNENWPVDLTKKIHSLTESKIAEWANLVNQLGMDLQNRQEWAEVFESEVRSKMEELVADVQLTQQALFEKIESLLKRANELCIKLSIEMPDYGCVGQGLYKEEQMMLKHVNELEEQVKQRTDEIKILMMHEEAVSKKLGKSPSSIQSSPLPSRAQIETYMAHIKNREAELAKRENLFNLLKSEIRQVADELKYKPELDFEKMILNGDKQDFVYTDFEMKQLENFHAAIIENRNLVKEEVSCLWESIKSLWERLGEDIQYCNEFLEKYQGNSLETYAALKDEEKRCEQLKKANIQIFVEKLRVEMKILWDKCKLTEEQRSKFLYYTDDTYTEDLLTLHDLEINRLKSYLKDNEEIFDLLEKREELWSKMLELEERSRAPDRFKNRGGQLLKEEKERNTLLKRIPKIEEKLLQLTTDYELKNGSEFLYWGETVNLVINRCHEKYENEKKESLSARKQQREKSVMLRNSKKRTPLKTTLLPNSFTPMRPNSSKRMLMTPVPSTGKRIKKANEIYKNGLKTAPSGINKATASTKLHYSIEKKKRMDKIRRLSKQMQEQKSFTTSPCNVSEYKCFEDELSSRGTCRSTLFQVPVKEYKIPEIVLNQCTPCSKTPRVARTPSRTNKLTTAKKLNLQL